MGKKKDKNDIEMYSGLVRLFTGPNSTVPVEDMSVERFPATSLGNAHAFLIQCARQWLDDNGYNDRGGMRVLYCAPDNAGLLKPARGKNLVTVPRQKTHRPARPAYACPVVQLCSTRYTGSVDWLSRTTYIQPVTIPDTQEGVL